MEMSTHSKNGDLDESIRGNYKLDNSLDIKSEIRYKWMTTSILYFCSLAYGMTSYIMGPALNDMKVRLETSTDSITIVFGCVLIGYTLGAIINGIVYNYINRQIVLVCLLILMACAITLAPHCPSLALLFVDTGLAGFGAGGFDTAQVVWIIELWAEKSGLYLQGIQFFFALGTFVSPLLSKPFLAEYNSTNTCHRTNACPTNIPDNSFLVEKSRIEIPFGIVGSVLVLSALSLLLLHFYKRYDPPIDQNQELQCKCVSSEKLVYIILGLLTLAPYVGMEIMNFQLAATFAYNSHLNLSEGQSANMLSGLAGAFTVGRGICFFISMKYRLENFIFVNYVIIIIANIILLLFEMREYSVSMLWTGNIILGLGLSSVFPAVYAFLERHITITNIMGAMFVCTSGLMAALLPTLCGQFIDANPLTLIYLNFICLSIIIIAFTTFHLFLKYKEFLLRCLS